ncbi:MAG TPA: HD domain-containing phosphohydrolase [Terriglobales bacterium]|jgi:putative nucleotidyltransferase with HDIG domain|nr:HD domain-containing phosphohydrolase [Terriglobales bacterium]
MEQSRPTRAPAQVARILFIVSLIAALTVAGFSVASIGWFPGVRILLAGMYLIPVLAATLWFRIRGGLVTAAVISLCSYAHLLFSPPRETGAQENHMAMIAIYWVLALTAGALLVFQEREKARRLAAEEQAERQAVVESITALLGALRARDEYTEEHSQHVAGLAVAIGRRRGLPPDRLEVILGAALMHDVGKIGIRDDVLLKPEELTEEERRRIQQHPQVAADILLPIRGAREIADIVLAHHECPDGSGYPQGRDAAHIPLEAHILHAADVFCSLTEVRAYKEAWREEEALAMMDAQAGRKFEAESVRLLAEIVRERHAQAA